MPPFPFLLRVAAPIVLIVAPFLAGTPLGQVTPAGPSSEPCLSRTVPPLCYSPQQFRTAYAIQPLLARGITGKGRTIVILGGGAVHSHSRLAGTYIRTSLRRYDQIFRLPDPHLSIIAPFGGSLTSSAVEEALEDVEVAHMVAPGAAIKLVIPPDGHYAAPTKSNVKRLRTGDVMRLVRVVAYIVVHNLGDIVSLSLGITESCLPRSVVQRLHAVFERARARGMTILVASGDAGTVGVACTWTAPAKGQYVNVPASDPLVTAVGGTMLSAVLPHGTYSGEMVWKERGPPPVRHRSYFQVLDRATGGGQSRVFSRPAYQNRVPGIGSWRALPDVALDASGYEGVVLVSSARGQTYYVAAGGTSAGAPGWAGIVALADQYAHRRLGLINLALYRIGRSAAYAAAFHDIVAGDSTVSVFLPSGATVQATGFSGGPGWDATTGWGTPKVSTLVPLLVQYSRPAARN